MKAIKNLNRKPFILALMLLTMPVVLYYLPLKSAAGDSIDWTKPGGMKIVSKHGTSIPDVPSFPGCMPQTIDVTTIRNSLPGVDSVEACVIKAKHLSIAYTYNGAFIAKHGDATYYRFAASSYHHLYVVPGSDRAMNLSSYVHRSGSALSIFDRISSRLELTEYDLAYRLVDTSDRLYPHYDDNPGTQDDDKGVYSAFLSRNGQYLVYSMSGGYASKDRYVRVNISTGETREFGRGWYNYTYSPLPAPHFAVSDDGRHVVGGGITRMKAWTIDDTCLAEVPDYMDNGWKDPCPSREITIEDYGEVLDPQSRDRISNLEFNEMGDEVSFIYSDGRGVDKNITISPPGYIAPFRLDYFAMGDSYSSGEGDIGKKPDGTSYYLSLTDMGKDNCHVSSRSYPFLLRDAWKIPNDKMKSVACSGAQVTRDYNSPLEGYKGQNERLRERSDVGQIQQTSLDRFIPGRVPQLEFVKRYKPKTITLTASGNDVGFAKILAYCASPKWSDAVPFRNNSCDYAVEGSELQKLLQDSINNQYKNIKKLVSDTKHASSTSRVIVVGYPSFITHKGDQFCGISGGALNNAEIDMINDNVGRLNSVLKRAAFDSGARYIDVEDSLNGGRICESGEFMTSAWDNIKGKAADQERFHPNHRGHQKIAKAIENSNVFDGPQAIGDGGSYHPTDSVISLLVELVPGGKTLLTSQSMGISVMPMMFKPNTTIAGSMFSDEIDLGTYEAANDGSFRREISTKNLPIGRHVLILSGTSLSGEPVKYFQFIEIGKSETDFDGDGVPDTVDRCSFISSWIDETTGKDICADKSKAAPKRSNKISEDADKFNNGNKFNKGAVQVEARVEKNVTKNHSDMVVKSDRQSDNITTPSPTTRAVKHKSTELLKIISAGIVVCIVLLSGYIYVRLKGKN